MKLQKEYVRIANLVSDRYKKDNNIIGITLAGGVSRGTGDIYSEIDLSFWVKNIKKVRNLPQSNEDIDLNGVWFDFHVLQLDIERGKIWNMDKRWDASQNKILFERKKVITNLFRKKVKFLHREREKLSEELRFKGRWCIALANVFIKRGDIKQAHMLVNESIDAFVDNYFIANNQFIPHYKWKYYFFQKLKKPNKKTKEAIFEAYKINSYSKNNLLKRIKIIKKEIINDSLKEDFFPAHFQNIVKVKEFVKNLKSGIKYDDPFKEDKKEKIR